MVSDVTSTGPSLHCPDPCSVPAQGPASDLTMFFVKLRDENGTLNGIEVIIPKTLALTLQSSAGQRDMSRELYDTFLIFILFYNILYNTIPCYAILYCTGQGGTRSL